MGSSHNYGPPLGTHILRHLIPRGTKKGTLNLGITRMIQHARAIANNKMAMGLAVNRCLLPCPLLCRGHTGMRVVKTMDWLEQ